MVGGGGEAWFGDAQGAVAVVEVVGVAFAVVFERVVVLVGVPAVEFDDEPGFGEVGVDLSAVEEDVDLRGAEVVFLDEGEEVVLEGGAGGVVGGLDQGRSSLVPGWRGLRSMTSWRAAGFSRPSRR